jgi:hypothetical protein
VKLHERLVRLLSVRAEASASSSWQDASRRSPMGSDGQRSIAIFNGAVCGIWTLRRGRLSGPLVLAGEKAHSVRRSESTLPERSRVVVPDRPACVPQEDLKVILMKRMRMAENIR